MARRPVGNSSQWTHWMDECNVCIVINQTHWVFSKKEKKNSERWPPAVQWATVLLCAGKMFVNMRQQSSAVFVEKRKKKNHTNWPPETILAENPSRHLPYWKLASHADCDELRRTKTMTKHFFFCYVHFVQFVANKWWITRAVLLLFFLLLWLPLVFSLMEINVWIWILKYLVHGKECVGRPAVSQLVVSAVVSSTAERQLFIAFN